MPWHKNIYFTTLYIGINYVHENPGLPIEVTLLFYSMS